MENCPACGYPLETLQEVPGSYRSKKKIKVKCTANDCTYTGMIIPSEENYYKVIENNIKVHEIITKLKQKIIE